MPEASRRVQVHLVAERGQAGDERDDEGQPDDPARAVGTGAAPSGDSGRSDGRPARRLRRAELSARASQSATSPAIAGADRPDQERTGQPEQLDQHEAGQERADHGAQSCWRSTAARTPG